MNRYKMDTKTVIGYIHSLGRFSGKPGLHRIRLLCNALGDPQDKLKFVHIAGTNGKGSTAFMIASVLRAAGYRTGLYTSPYLVRFNERMRVDGVMISDTELTEITEKVQAAVERLKLPENETIGEFEFATAVGFLYFLEKKCDVVVLETGLGGRFDATNVIDVPEACVITTVSLDHTEVLGDDVKQIAYEKAGIIKPGTVVVSAPDQDEAVKGIIKSACHNAGAALHKTSGNGFLLLRSDIEGSAFVYEGQGYTLSLPGKHQIRNALTVLGTVEALRSRGFDIPVSSVVKGLARARVPGRLEKKRESPLILLDGAHNVGGVEALCGFIDGTLKMRRLHIVMGMMRDKLYESCIKELAARAGVFYACSQEDSLRALPAQTIAAIAERSCREVYDCGDVGKALRLAVENAGDKDVIIVCGSLYLVGEAEKILSARQKPAE